MWLSGEDYRWRVGCVKMKIQAVFEIKAFFERDENLSCHVRPMGKVDISQITEIDREAFPNLWPPANYQRELENRLAHYLVACDDSKTVDEPVPEVKVEMGFSGLACRMRRLFNYRRFSGDGLTGLSGENIVGFAGFWIMADEAHLTNIAVRESCRRQGIGELLLISVVDLAAELKAANITLEVRASNTAAQNLYRKYGFVEVGLRRNYYVNDREDGVLMSTENIHSELFQADFRQLKQAYTTEHGIALH